MIYTVRNYAFLFPLSKIIFLLLTINCKVSFAEISGQPANSYVSGTSWFCRDGYQKSGNSCLSIFANFPNGQPTNSYVSGTSWFCRDGYKKFGENCISIFSGESAPNQLNMKNNASNSNALPNSSNASDTLQKTKSIKKINPEKSKELSDKPLSGGLPPLKN